MLSSEEVVSPAAAAPPQPGLLSLAGDAICLAVAALRLGPETAPKASAPKASTPKASAPKAPASKTSAPREIAEEHPVPADLLEVSLAEVAWHDHYHDCWMVVYDRVYDVTDFLYQHPGGEEILLEYAGRDATLAFAGIGHGPAMLRALRPYLVGRLPPAERIYSLQAAERGVLQLVGL